MTSQLGETREEMASSLIVLFLLKYPSLPKERSLPRATAIVRWLLNILVPVDVSGTLMVHQHEGISVTQSRVI